MCGGGGWGLGGGYIGNRTFPLLITRRSEKRIVLLKPVAEWEVNRPAGEGFYEMRWGLEVHKTHCVRA